MEIWEVKGKSCIITGGASGLGAGYVQRFLEQGAKQIAVLDVAEDIGKETADRLNKIHGDKVIFIKCDVSLEEEITGAFNSVVDQFKQIDIIVNNAGIMVDAPDIWRKTCDINYRGLVSFTLKGISHMRKDEGGVGGTIVNISSTTAINKGPYLPIYSGTKMAVLHFSQCIAMDPFYENTGIRLLTFCPGPTNTPLLQNLDTLSYDVKLGVILDNEVKETKLEFQRVESAVTAFIHMCKYGTPGSIWLSIDNKPAQDITSVLNRVFDDLTAVTMGPAGKP